LVCLALVVGIYGYFPSGMMTKELLTSWNATFSYNEHGDLTYRVRIPTCDGGPKSMCWEQTDATSVTLDYQDTTGAFPCRAGTNRNIFFGTNHDIIQSNNELCQIVVSGLGGSNGNAGLCKVEKGSFGSFGLDCNPTPLPADTAFTAEGDDASCQAGIGAYTATMTCSQQGQVIFRFSTYFTY